MIVELVSQVRGGASSSKPVPSGSALPAFGAGAAISSAALLLPAMDG